MSMVDWSLAPSWCNGYGLIGYHGYPVWFDDDQYQYLASGDVHKFAHGCTYTRSELQVIERRKKPWSGPEDGLPPCDDEFFIRRHNFQMPPVSEAPDGATHWDPGIRSTATWAMKCDGIWYWHPVYGEAIENCWSPYSNLSLDTTTFIRIEHKWNGDGLPPVNAIVHCGTHNRDVEVLTKPELISHASGEYVTAACRAIDNQELFWGGRFNPIRTPSEIAAEKRETAIREFMDVVGIDCRVTASKAVDAGFKREVV